MKNTKVRVTIRNRVANFEGGRVYLYLIYAFCRLIIHLDGFRFPRTTSHLPKECFGKRVDVAAKVLVSVPGLASSAGEDAIPVRATSRNVSAKRKYEDEFGPTASTASSGAGADTGASDGSVDARAFTSIESKVDRSTWEVVDVDTRKRNHPIWTHFGAYAPHSFQICICKACYTENRGNF
jgi:hypothetical protein